MLTYIARRLMLVLPTMLIVTFCVTALIEMAPGDPATVLLGEGAHPDAVARLQDELNLDRPLIVRYGIWLLDAFRGDFGYSWQRNEPVVQMIAARLPASLELASVALVVQLLLAVPIGVIAAVKRGTVVDWLFIGFSLIWISVPSFWLGILLLFVFSVELGFLPVSGRGGSLWTVNGIRHILLPALAVGLRHVAVLARMTRSQMLDVLREDYVRTAFGKGLTERRVLYRHSLRNAFLPVLTLFGLSIPALFGATVIIENIFAWPGTGRMLVDAALKRDFPLVQGLVVFYTFVVIIANLVVDLLYAYVDPRIRYG